VCCVDKSGVQVEIGVVEIAWQLLEEIRPPASETEPYKDIVDHSGFV